MIAYREESLNWTGAVAAATARNYINERVIEILVGRLEQALMGDRLSLTYEQYAALLLVLFPVSDKPPVGCWAGKHRFRVTFPGCHPVTVRANTRTEARQRAKHVMGLRRREALLYPTVIERIS